MKAGYIDEISNWTGLEGLSAADLSMQQRREPENCTPRLLRLG
jgi:hypothetical protein